MNQTVSVPAGPAVGAPVSDTWWATHCTSPEAVSPTTANRWLVTRWKVRS